MTTLMRGQGQRPALVLPHALPVPRQSCYNYSQGELMSVVGQARTGEEAVALARTETTAQGCANVSQATGVWI